MTAVIEARELRKEFTVTEKAGRFRRMRRTVAAVDGIDLAVDRGEMVGYIGPNGAGKSTTLKMMTGVLTPTGGSVSVCGLRPVAERTRLALRIGVVFGQRSQLWWDLPLHDSFELLRHVYRVPATDHAARLRECRSLLGLDEFEATPVRQLSLGQRMRGEITAALLHRPDVLFLDEPTIGLDVVSKQAVRAFLTTIGAAGDTTLMLTTHDLADIERLCPRLVVIDHGHVVHDGSLAELHARYRSRRRVLVDLDAPVDLAAAQHIGAPASEIEAVTAAIGDVGPGVTVEHVSRDGCRIEFGLRDGANAGALVARIAVVASLRDLSVIEPDIEDVVARIYRD